MKRNSIRVKIVFIIIAIITLSLLILFISPQSKYDSKSTEYFIENNNVVNASAVKSSSKVFNNMVLYDGSDRKYAADVRYCDNIGVGEKNDFYIDFVQTRLNCGWVTHVVLRVTFTVITPNGTRHYKSLDHTFKGNDDNQSCRLFDGSILNEDGIYTVSMSGSVIGGSEAGQSNSFTFRYDNTPPSATLTGVNNNSATKGDVTASTDSGNSMRLYRTSPQQNSWDYTGWVIRDEGDYRLEVTDGINSVNYYFTIDKTAPGGTLNGVAEGGTTDGYVTFTWSENGATATLDGRYYSSGQKISADGQHTIILKDHVGNERLYNFRIDTSRPYISNADEISTWFSLSSSKVTAISEGQIGDAEIDFGVQAPGFNINFADSYSNITVNAIFKPYSYDANGNIEIGTEQSVIYGESVEFNKSGEYILTVSDAFEHKLIIKFTLKASHGLNNDAYVEKNQFFIIHDINADNILNITQNDYENGVRINYLINGTGGVVESNVLTAAKMQEIINEHGTTANNLVIIRITSLFTDEIYFIKPFACSFEPPKIKNETELKSLFNGGNADYWGITQTDFSFNINANIFELDVTAKLEQTLLAYDLRNVLYAKKTQNVEYTSGAQIVNDGYYKLTLVDAVGRVKTIKFARINEFKSANEYMLKNEYYIAPNYVSVKLPVSFGNFEIKETESVKNRYLGNFTAEKSYLFTNIDNAIEFAFAAEYSVCVQNTSSGFLYRAGNQGIQIAYNDFNKLADKIRQVIKSYIKEKSYEISDMPYIDYTTKVVMDNELKYNALYKNIAELTYNGTKYNNVLMADNEFYLKLNSVNIFSGINAVITITHIDTGNVFTTNKNSAFGTITGGVNGLYRITEQCPGGDDEYTLTYYVYIDNIAPVADITSVKASERTENVTVTVGDTIIIQAAEFRLNNVIDSTDMYCMIKITGYGFENAISVMLGEAANILISSTLGHKGLYNVEIYDRAKNRFAFEVYIMSKAPEAVFIKNGSGDSEYVNLTISLPDKYCVVMDLTISRNKTEESTGELSVDSDNMPISPAVLSYVFRKGGRYTVVIVDNYERTTIIELRYIKDMPEITAEGLNKARRVNGDVIISIPLNAEFTVTTQDNSQFKYNALSDSTQGKQIITISPRNEYNEYIEINDTIVIKAWYESDPDAYNDLSYILDTIAPNIEITNENNETMFGSVFSQAIKFTYDGDVKEFAVNRGGKYYSYVSGQLIRNDGIYQATATDIAGNTTIIEIVVDMTVTYTISLGDNKQYVSNFESIEGTPVTIVKSFRITPEEQLAVTATKDSYKYEYLPGETVSVNGLYIIKMTDNIGNSITMPIRVISAVTDIAVYTKNNKLLGYNTSTNESIRIEYSDLNYIKQVEFRRGITYSTYVKGEYITIAGNYTFYAEDVVGNELIFNINIDKQIDMTIDFDKSFVLNDENTLTKRFKIVLSEIDAKCNLLFNGESIEYQPNTWYAANGLYSYQATDSVGNEVIGNITVIGETLPSITIKDSHDEKIEENSIINHSFVLSWNDKNYISSVQVNGEIINNGAIFERDGKYNIIIVDLLERTKAFTINLVTAVDYEVDYRGSYKVVEENKEITLTRGFAIKSNSNLTITAELNGISASVNLWKNYNAVGDWKIILNDDAGNTVTLYIQVRDKAFMPKLLDFDGAEVMNGDVTNKIVSIVYDEFISEITVDGNIYTKGDYITSAGRHTINITDCIGNVGAIHFESDFAVDCTINFGKKYEKYDCALTNRFSITLNENGLIKISFDGEPIEPINGFYTATGIYVITIKDNVGNILIKNIEIDNRMPQIDYINSFGEKFKENIINKTFTVNWNDEQNIAEVKINGITVEKGIECSASGKYTIEITNLLGINAVKIIEIRREVQYELTLGINHSYSKESRLIILTDKFNINGVGITIECITENGNLFLENGEWYSTNGFCEIVITDTAGNHEILNINVSTSAFQGAVKIGDVAHEQNISTNQSFIIEYGEFVKTITVNGSEYLNGIISKEGKHVIEYVDVLGRISTQTIIIDLTVDIFIEHIKTEIIDNVETLLNKKLSITTGENIDLRVWHDGIEIFDFNVSKIDGLYEILAIDKVGNQSFLTLLIDNEPPKILVSEPDLNNAVNVKISDKTNMNIEVYKKQVLWLSNETDFIINENGNFTVRASDSLGNLTEIKISTDMEVDLTANFLNGQTVNFKPKFVINEEITYSMRFNGEIIEYKLNDELAEKGEYTIWFKDKQNNELLMKFDYIGNNKKQQICNWKLPAEYDGYVVKHDGITLDIKSDENGRLRLDKDGLYSIAIFVEGEEMNFNLQIISTPPKISLSGIGADLVTKETVNISSTSEYIVFFNGEEIGQPVAVSDPGKYKIVATDEAGNTKIIEFEIQYSLNPYSILLVIIVSIILAAILIMAIKYVINKQKIYRRTYEK